MYTHFPPLSAYLFFHLLNHNPSLLQWVIADYKSDTLNLNNPATFRDLSKPMGAQTPARLQTLKRRFEVSAFKGRMSKDSEMG